MRRLKGALSLIVIVAVFASCKKPPTEPSPHSATGSIRGAVIDDSTNVPVKGAIVTINELSKKDTTDSMGQFLFENIEKGDYSLTISKYPFKDTTLSIHVEGNETVNVEVRMKYIGPANWYVIDSFGSPIVQVFFIDYYNGWLLAGGDGIWWGDKIYRTIDGEHFNLVYQFPAEDSVRKIFFVNNRVGWAVGMKIWKTEDGGNTWTEQLNVDSIYGGIARGLYFYNENEGFVVGGKKTGSNFIWKTNDGGNNWQIVESFTQSDNCCYDLYDIDMKEERGLVAGEYTGGGWDWHIPGCLYSTDSGNTWFPVTDHFTPLNRIPFHKVQLYSHGHAVKLWVTEAIAFSSNNGVDWYDKTGDLPDSQPYCDYFLDETHGWLGAENGIYFTKDEGTTWESQWTGDKVTSLYMLDLNWGYAGTYEGYILRYERRR